MLSAFCSHKVDTESHIAKLAVLIYKAFCCDIL
jgi:hypothetical protein